MAVRGRCGWAPSITVKMGRRRSTSLLLLVVAILVCAADGVSGRRGRRLEKRDNAIYGNQKGEQASKRNETVTFLTLSLALECKSYGVTGKGCVTPPPRPEAARTRDHATVPTLSWDLRYMVLIARC